MHTLMSTTVARDTCRQKTFTAHHPDTITRNARKGWGDKVPQKNRQNTATSPKAAASSP